MQKSFAELIASAEGKDQEAISELYNRTYPGVYKTAKAIIQDEDAVLDIVQDTYIKAFQNLHQLDDPDKFPAWVKRIAVNQAKDYLKKKKPILFTEMENEDGDTPEFRDDNMDVQPEAVIDRQDTTELINRILSTLGDEQRITIVMFYYQELSVEEIAKAQGCSVNTVKSRLNYGRKKVEKAVLKLEKQGVKLYSMAPLPFLLWLFKAAKTANISAASLAQVSAVGAATAGAAAGTTAAGEAAAGSTAVGNAAATATAKAVGGTAAKAVSTKIIAGALAVTIAGGGAIAISSNSSPQKKNARAHQIYEAFLADYKEVLDMDEETRNAEETRFWEELKSSVLKKYPDDMHILEESDENLIYYASGDELNVSDPAEISNSNCPSRSFTRELFYCWGDQYTDTDIPIPNTKFKPCMLLPTTSYLINSRLIPEKDFFLEDSLILYGFHDFDSDGVDELVMWLSNDDSHAKGFISVYEVLDDHLVYRIFRTPNRGTIVPCTISRRSWDLIDREYHIQMVYDLPYIHSSFAHDRYTIFSQVLNEQSPNIIQSLQYFWGRK